MKKSYKPKQANIVKLNSYIKDVRKNKGSEKT